MGIGNHGKDYLHGFTQEEQARLYRQARFMEHSVHDRLPFSRCRNLLEVGCGVGAQSEILLRRFPELKITGVDASEANLGQAKQFLDSQAWAKDRFTAVVGQADHLHFESDTFDAAFLCWILEHVPNPALALSEVRRVLRRGAPVVITEVQNASFFLNPYSPATLSFWSAFNDYQLDMGGDPFVGAKLGNLLLQVGFRDIHTEVKTEFLDSRTPKERAEFITYWTDLLLSAAPALLAAQRIGQDLVDDMRKELSIVARAPDAVFFSAYVQAKAVAD